MQTTVSKKGCITCAAVHGTPILLLHGEGVTSLLVSHSNQGSRTPSVSEGKEVAFARIAWVSDMALWTAGSLSFKLPPRVELVSLLSPSKDDISVSSTFDRKSSKYFCASSVKCFDVLVLSLLLWNTNQVQTIWPNCTHAQAIDEPDGSKESLLYEIVMVSPLQLFVLVQEAILWQYQ